MTVLVRGATAADQAAVVALWHSCGLVVSYNDPVADFKLARGKENSDVLVARTANQEIVASVMVGHDGHRGWLYYVAVVPDYQGEGIGRLIVEAGEKWLAERGIAKVQLLVRGTNTAVVSFYERIGFETVPRTVMQKWLAKKPSD
ncbi:MAG TPA: GNAT family acetyltransferase [Xanthobacteraceae bacterium]